MASLPKSKTPVLDALINMMTRVVENKQVLHMENLFYSLNSIQNPIDRGEPPTIHNCGTAACVMGYAALDEPTRNAANVTVASSEKSFARFAYEDAARAVWNALDKEIGSELAGSIANGDAHDRQDSLKVYQNSTGNEVSWAKSYYHIFPENHDYDQQADPEPALTYMIKLREKFNEYALL